MCQRSGSAISRRPDRVVLIAAKLEPMDPVFFRQVQCPYCGEPIELAIDSSAGEQAYVEDCQVCCRPIEVLLVGDCGEWRVEVGRDDQ